MLDKIYAQTTAASPTLEPNKHLRLVNTELFSSINPGFIILLTPLIVAFWHFLRARGWEPSTSAKIGLGLIQTGGAAAIMFWATLSCDESQAKSSDWRVVG